MEAAEGIAERKVADMSVRESVTRFMHETQALLAREGIAEPSLRDVGKRLSELAREPDLISEAELSPLHGSDATVTVLYSLGADALTLLLARFPASAPTPIHDHDSWGVACVVAGRDRYMHWERVDAGTYPGHARLRLLYERELGAGEYVVWMGQPHDIHSQQGIGGAAWELVLFGKNTMVLPRRYFDLQTGIVCEALP
jgi:predicted metal-dependent enzyme (double-stranded beta helix superfamily)